VARRKEPETAETTLEIPLVHARWRHLAWALACLLLGGFLILRSGTFGLVVGIPLLALSANAARGFVVTLLHPAGVVAVTEDELLLPPRLCAGESVTVPIDELKHAYLLRKHVPWHTTGPVLVVETGRGVFQYPRDWFGADHDQWRLTKTLNRRLGRLE
jgi:hypothetical protein